MGPSGSGKSTLLHCLSGVLTPDAGTVTFDGREISSLKDKERSHLRLSRFGFVFQDGQLIPELPARENVALPLMLTGTRRGTALTAADDVLGRIGIAELRDRRPGDMSGGQAQRVAIARALVGKPKVVFADEPSGALDQATGHEVMQLLTTTVARSGASLVMVTHDYAAVCPACATGALGVGFHRSLTLTEDGNLTAKLVPGETEVENLLLSEFTVEEPPGFLGTSFASPLLAGLAALLSRSADLPEMARLSFAATPIHTLAMLYREYLSVSPPRTVATLRAGFMQLAAHVPAAHQHWREGAAAPCALCSLFADLYDNAVSVLIHSGASDDAVALGRVAAAVAPFSPGTASNLGLALEQSAGPMAPPARRAALEAAIAEYRRAILLATEEGDERAASLFAGHLERASARAAAEG